MDCVRLLIQFVPFLISCASIIVVNIFETIFEKYCPNYKNMLNSPLEVYKAYFRQTPHQFI